VPHRIKRTIAGLALAPALLAQAAVLTPSVAQTFDRRERQQETRTLRGSYGEPVDEADRLDERRSSDTLQRDGGGGADGTRDRSANGTDGLRGTIETGTDGPDAVPAAQGPQAPVGETPEPLEPLDVAEDPVLETIEEDPYAPIGVRMGSFLLFPELAAESVYNDNIFLSSIRPEGDWALALTPALRVQSDWSRHSLEANVGGEYSFHERFRTEDDESFAADVTGQIDLRRSTNIVASAGYSRAFEDRSSSDFPANAAERPLVRSNDWSLGGNHTFNRLTLTLRGDVSTDNYGDSVAVDGSLIDNSGRDYTERRLTSRAGYEFQPGVQAFVEGSVNERDFVEAVDSGGQLNGSSGHDIQAGLAFKLSGKLTGEASAGYALQTPDDPTLKDVDGLIFNAALEYKPTALTTLRFDAASQVAETTVTGSAGSINRNVEFSAEHRPRRNIILGASIGYQNEKFSGTGETDEDWTTGLTGEYLFTPSVGLIVSYEHVESTSSVPGNDYSTNEVRMGMRFRR